MSDFFTRLAERTLGFALIIQPITPSVFAPGPDAGADMPFEIMEESAAAQTEPVGASAKLAERGSIPRPSPIYRPLVHAHYPETFAVQPERSQAEAPRSAAISAQAQYTEASAPRSAVTRAGQSTGYTPTKLSVNDALSQTNIHRASRHDRRRPPTVESFSLDSTYTRESTPVTGKIELAAQQSILNDQSTIISRTYPGSYDESLPSRHTESGQNSTISAINKKPAAIPPTQMSVGAGEELGGVGDFMSARWGGRDRANRNVGTGGGWVDEWPCACPAPSTIQVTIGRVEVRAVTSPATTTHSQQQPVKPPTMSLDEYLQRQEQGGRR